MRKRGSKRDVIRGRDRNIRVGYQGYRTWASRPTHQLLVRGPGANGGYKRTLNGREEMSENTGQGEEGWDGGTGGRIQNGVRWKVRGMNREGCESGREVRRCRREHRYKKWRRGREEEEEGGREGRRGREVEEEGGKKKRVGRRGWEEEEEGGKKKRKKIEGRRGGREEEGGKKREGRRRGWEEEEEGGKKREGRRGRDGEGKGTWKRKGEQESKREVKSGRGGVGREKCKGRGGRGMWKGREK
ncbi:hypothetical protein Pcinc_011966 [Petrolisthes cinctipes]|uniref:Uncharacterized protein n=1 Tax=Petrolisthes cinctipes TaxID=88211 RepID=A0AAE1KTZ5_PETCI|nr:hypothetical protein Pcinc_011966 [Petrolisthes cinctipes]